MGIMAPLAFLMIFIACIVIYAFYAFPPAFVDKRTVSVYNNMVMAVGILFSLVYIFNIAVFFSEDSVEKYRLALMVIGVCGIQAVYLILFFVLRNFWIFKSRRFGAL